MVVTKRRSQEGAVILHSDDQGSTGEGVGEKCARDFLLRRLQRLECKTRHLCGMTVQIFKSSPRLVQSS